MSLGGPAECDWTGCGAQRREVNRWYVVTDDSHGVHIWKWEMCSDEDMRIGKHFCGLQHAFLYASNVLTPDQTKVNRESTLELKPPLTREGTAPEKIEEPPTEQEHEEENKENGN